MKGEYKERMQYIPADIVVSGNSCRIMFYFSGIDMRYNGRIFYIEAADIDKYINAYNDNWIKYTQLKMTGMSGSLTVDGTMGMKIIIGSSLEGIAINKFDYRLRAKKDIDLAIEDLKSAKARGKELLEILSNI